MVSVDKAVIAKYKTHGQNFEILVDCDSALEFRSGKQADIKDILAAPKIFSDAKKGLAASETAMRQIFNTSEPLEIAKIIIQKGELPLTTEYREKLREQKRRQIIDYIHRNAVDPKTHLPHPSQRIENAMEEVKAHIDEFQDTQRQIQDILKKMREVLPLKFEIKEIAVKIPPEYAPKSYGVLASFGKKLNEEWQNDGSLVAVLEMPAGLEEDFHRKLNDICHGNVETKVIKIR